MRVLTTYEKKKWGEGYDFEEPEFLNYGDEAGEDYDTFVHAARQALAFDEQLAEYIQALALDCYYDNVEWLIEDGRNYYDLGFPAYKKIQEKYQEIHEIDYPELPAQVARMMALDWAVEYQKEHAEEHYEKQRRQQLLDELEKLGN